MVFLNLGGATAIGLGPNLCSLIAATALSAIPMNTALDSHSGFDQFDHTKSLTASLLSSLRTHLFKAGTRKSIASIGQGMTTIGTVSSRRVHTLLNLLRTFEVLDTTPCPIVVI